MLSASVKIIFPSVAAPLLKSPIPPSIRYPYAQAITETSEGVTRRGTAFLLSAAVVPLFPYLLQPRVASAFSLGISGPKEWLKEQKKKSAKYLLAPIDASLNIVQSVYDLLTQSEGDLGENDLDKVQKLVVTAARDCIPEDRNFFVVFQANTGVEVCTFSLILKNASSLLDDRDPIKLEAEAKLSYLIRSFSSLNDLTREGGVQLVSNRAKFVDALKDTVISLNIFEQGIKDCLQV